MTIILYIIGVGIYCCLPLPLQIPILLLNTMLPDPIPYLDEIIMYASTLKKLARLASVIEWIEDHTALAIAIFIGVVVLCIFGLWCLLT